MSNGEGALQATLGFLTILEHEQQGFVGGYLILNTAGRPLEFHCTAPIRPNRAQQILFGPTLESYLYGEQIGQTLLAKGSVEPLAVCTDVELALSVRQYVDLPVALVLKGEAEPRVDGPPACAGFALAHRRSSSARPPLVPVRAGTQSPGGGTGASGRPPANRRQARRAGRL